MRVLVTLGRESHWQTSGTIRSLHIMRGSRQIRLLVWSQVTHRVVPLNRSMGLSNTAPNRIRRTLIGLAYTKGYDGASRRLLPLSQVRIMLYKMIPILDQGWRYVFSIGWGQWGFPSNQGLCPNWDFSCKGG
jgi:hypothetical protein